MPFPRANCYGYALSLDNNVEPGTLHGDASVISDWSHLKVKRITKKHREDLLAACEHDGLTQKSTLLGEDAVKIAVVIHQYEDCIDYHFYRQEPDQWWTHKLGKLEQVAKDPRTTDASLVGLSINNGEILHQVFVGFMWAPKPFPVEGDDWGD